MQKSIFHIAFRSDLQDAMKLYSPASVTDCGFIHCAGARQLEDIIQRKFAGRTDVVLMKIDPDRVEAKIRHENLTGGSELYPHIYGPLNMDAVVSVEPLDISHKGTSVLSDEEGD